jgi:predicted amidophosphoribosyltransferase
MTRTTERLDRLREWLVSVERAWVGWSLAPPERVLAEAAWHPDAPGTYCRRCGGSVGTGEQTPDGCGSCRDHVVNTDRVVRLSAYRDPMRAWVRAIKYRSWAEMAECLGRRLGDQLHHALGCDGPPEVSNTVLTPIPMPWQRRLYRGIDHARLIAEGAAVAMGVPVVQFLAAENGPPQVSLTAAGRSRRVVRMTVRSGLTTRSLRDTVVVLIDDVRTRGSSLNAAARLVRRLGPRLVVAGVLAVTDDPARRGT